MFVRPLLVLVLVMAVVYCRPCPRRDSYSDRIINEESLIREENPAVVSEKAESQYEVTNKSVYFKKVACGIEGPGDDNICADYCSKKGYHHGVCISFACNCV